MLLWGNIHILGKVDSKIIRNYPNYFQNLTHFFDQMLNNFLFKDYDFM